MEKTVSKKLICANECLHKHVQLWWTQVVVRSVPVQTGYIHLWLLNPRMLLQKTVPICKKTW